MKRVVHFKANNIKLHSNFFRGNLFSSDAYQRRLDHYQITVKLEEISKEKIFYICKIKKSNVMKLCVFKMKKINKIKVKRFKLNKNKSDFM